MPHRDYDIKTDLLTLCRKRRQLQLICTMCGYCRAWQGHELVRLAQALGNCSVGRFRARAFCSRCGAKQPRPAIEFMNYATQRSVPLRVGTLGDVLAERRYLSVSCGRIGCGNSMQPDLAALVEKYGADYPLQRFLERCRCGKCQARWPQVGLQVPPMKV